MKKLIIISLILIIMLFAVACGSNDNLKTSNTENTKSTNNVETSLQTSSLDVTSSISDGSILNDESNDNSNLEFAKIKIVTPDGDIIITLENNSATQDLLGRLPLTLHFDDYNNTEKISYIDNALDTSSAVTQYTPKANSFAYYIPWGNLSIFYEDFRESSGLALLGSVESGLEYVKQMDNYDSVTIDVLQSSLN